MSGDDVLREAIAVAIYASDFGDSGDWDEERDHFQGEYRANADAVLALPALEAWAEQRARQRAADLRARVGAVAEAMQESGTLYFAARIRDALAADDRDGDQP